MLYFQGLMKAVLAFAVLLAAFGAVPLSPRASQFRSGLDVVQVYATVRTSDGAFARGLTREDFELLDNGRRREISVFSSDIQPSTIAMVLDRSGSVASRTRAISNAAEVFIRKLGPDDRASLSSLTWDCQSLTKDKEKLVEIARSAMPSDPGSPIWAGTFRAMSSVTHEDGRRAVILFSDGDDHRSLGSWVVTNQVGSYRLVTPPATPAGPNTPCVSQRDTSLATIDDIVHRAEREGVMLYTVSVDDAGGAPKDGDLRRVARESGGERYRLSDYQDLPSAFERIADDLHHQYLLGFVPAVFDGKRHDIEVRVKQRGVSVRARRSYVAVRENAASPAEGGEFTPNRPAGISAADIDWAIEQGQGGKTLEAACAAPTGFSKEGEDHYYAQIVAEGPIGRVMRAAREAKQKRLPFTAADVTDSMRAPTVRISAELKRASDTAGFSRTGGPGWLVTMRVRSRDMIASYLEPLEPAIIMGPGFRPPRPPLVQHFDLAAFHALPGDDVEVVAHSVAGARKCTIPANDARAIR